LSTWVFPSFERSAFVNRFPSVDVVPTKGLPSLIHCCSVSYFDLHVNAHGEPKSTWSFERPWTRIGFCVICWSWSEFGAVTLERRRWIGVAGGCNSDSSNAAFRWSIEWADFLTWHVLMVWP